MGGVARAGWERVRGRGGGVRDEVRVGGMERAWDLGMGVVERRGQGDVGGRRRGRRGVVK